MPEDRLSPAAHTFLLNWTPTDTELTTMTDHLAALLDEVRAEAVREERDRLYAYLFGVRQGLDAEEKAGVLPAIAAATGREVASLLIRNLTEATRTGGDPWKPKLKE